MGTGRRALLVLLVPLLLALTSCVRMQANYRIVSGDRIEVIASVGVEKSVAEQGDKPVTKEQLCEGNDTAGAPDTTDLHDLTKEPYDDGAYLGCRITGWGTLAELGDVITLHDGVWTFHMASPETKNAEEADQAAKLISDFRVSVAFPDEVLTHSGSSTVENRTVTWADAHDLYSGDGLTATGKEKSAVNPWLVQTGLLLVLLVVATALVIRQQRRQKAKAAREQAAFAYEQAPVAPLAPDGGMPVGQPHPPSPPPPAPAQSPWERVPEQPPRPDDDPSDWTPAQPGDRADNPWIADDTPKEGDGNQARGPAD
ncbi:LppM family (lipo)protein [Aestuariimicrobium soli]|uniref:LppM family (lipo)protein n=1 Tax=Aestuariimicrobium soli TaxID=2035834 RepID=UPI003EBD5FF7